MNIGLDVITGVSCGVEYVTPIDDECEHVLMVDIFIIRLLFMWPQ